MSQPIALNQPAPAFTAESTAGTISLSDYAGQYVVLYFYPKDNTPGCTNESKDFRDRYDQFKALNAEIIGVSRDSLSSHEKFRAKLELPFHLIADTESALCDSFGVIKDKMMFGKQVRGIERSTFLIDPEGNLAAEWRKVKVAGHADAVLETLKAQA